MTYIPHMISRTLAYYICNGLTNTLPANDLDITTVTDPHVSFLETDLFLSGSHWSYPFDLTSPVYAAIKGRLMDRYGQIIFIPDDGEDYDPIYLTDRCRYESSELKYNSSHRVVLMISDPEDPRHSGQMLVVTLETYALANPLPSLYDKWFFITELLDLEREDRAALTQFLTNAGVAQSFFLYAAHLASHTIRAGSQLDDGDIVEIMDRFESFLGRFQSFHLHYADVDALIQLSQFHYREEDWYRLLTLWAILHNCSAWSNECNDAQALLASGIGHAQNLDACLKLICQPHELNALARQLTEDAVYQSDPEQCRAILLQILYTGIAINPQILPCVTRCLFHRPMDLNDVSKLLPLRETTNWDHLLDDVMIKVCDSLENSVTAYTTALAALWICEIGAQRETVLQDAQNMLLNDEPATALTGTLMLSMVLEDDLHSSERSKRAILLEKEDAIVRQLLTWLRDPNTIHHNSAIILYRDMHLLCGTDCAPLTDPNIMQAAFRRLEQGHQNQTYISILFSLMPLDPEPPDDPRLVQFRPEAAEHFNQLLSLTSSENTPAHFRACLAAGCWFPGEALANYGKLLSWADRHCSYLESLDHVYLTKLKTDIAAMLLGGSLPSEASAHLLPSPDQAKACPMLFHKAVTSCEEAYSVIRYVANHCSDPHFDWSELRSQVKGAQFDIPGASSFPVAQWFYSLCLLGLHEDACLFYHQFQDILNRPYRFRPDNEKGFLWPYRAMNHFLNSEPSRLTMGLRIAELSGNYALIWGLLLQDGVDAKLRSEYFPVVDYLTLGIHRENRCILKQAFLPDMQENLFNIWCHYYDDPSVTLSVLEKHPEHHKEVLSFGYAGIKEIAIAAVTKNAESLCYVSKELLRDDQICLAAMNDPGQVLHLMQAPITFNRPLISQLLEEQKEFCAPSQVHCSFLNDRDYAIQAMMRYPEEFHLLSQNLRYDKAVLMTAIASSTSGYLVQHILKHTDPVYSSDHEIMISILALYPETIELAEKAFPGDPVLEALASRRHYLSSIRQKQLSWEYRYCLGLEL